MQQTSTAKLPAFFQTFQTEERAVKVNIIEKKKSPSLSSFLHFLLKTMKLFKKCFIYYFDYLKIILNDDLFKEYTNLMVFINLTVY